MTALVILAGGAGARMGGNKPLHPYGGATLIEAVINRLRPQAADLVVNAGTRGSPVAHSLENLAVPLIFDEAAYAQMGPLSGVLSALKFAEAMGLKAVVTAPCDMPLLPANMVAQLLNSPSADIVHFAGTHDYPLCALWRSSLRSGLETALAAARSDKGLPVMRYLSAHSVHRIVVDDDSAFFNINSPAMIGPHHV